MTIHSTGRRLLTTAVIALAGSAALYGCGSSDGPTAAPSSMTGEPSSTEATSSDQPSETTEQASDESLGAGSFGELSLGMSPEQVEALDYPLGGRETRGNCLTATSTSHSGDDLSLTFDLRTGRLAIIGLPNGGKVAGSAFSAADTQSIQSRFKPQVFQEFSAPITPPLGGIVGADYPALFYLGYTNSRGSIYLSQTGPQSGSWSRPQTSVSSPFGCPDPGPYAPGGGVPAGIGPGQPDSNLRPSDGMTGQSRPSELGYLSLGQGRISTVEQLTWSSWGQDKAVGTGLGMISRDDGTDPGRAEYERVAVEVTLYDVGTCPNGEAYRSYRAYLPTEGETFDTANESETHCT